MSLVGFELWLHSHGVP